MKIISKIVLIGLTVSCSSLSPSNKCNENYKFKTKYFQVIKNIEDYVKGNGDRIKFNEGLNFLSKYVRISKDKMLNYDNSYESIDAFNSDKVNWLDWYERNKCSNILLKK